MCESDWISRREDDIGGGHRGADGARRLGRVRVALGDHRQRRVGARLLGLNPHPLPQPLSGGIANDEHLLTLGDAEAVAHNRPHRPFKIVTHGGEG